MKNWTIGRRLAAGFSLLLLLSAISALIATTTLHGIRQEIVGISRDALPALEIVNHLQRNVLTDRILVNRHVLSDSDDEMRQIDGQCDEIAQSALRQIKQYGGFVVGAEEQALFDRIEPALNSYREAASRIRALSRDRKNAEAIALLKGDGARSYSAFEDSVNAVVAYNDQSATAQADGIEQDAG